MLTKHHRTAARLAAVLRALVLLGAGAYLALFAVLVCFRLGYPFELEWLEGAMVDHVRTILSGAPLYAKPSLAFIPLTYTPGYFYLAAALSKVLGTGFLPLRLIAVLASIGVLAVLYRLASRETGDFRAGILAAGLFAAMFGWTDGWLDLARNDSLFLLLALLAMYVLRWHPPSRAYVMAGILFSLSFLVKQTGLIVAVPMAVWCGWRGWRAMAVFAGTVAALLIATTVSLERAFDGWYLYYVRDVPAQHPLALEMLWGFWRYDVLRPFPLALPVSAAYVLIRLRDPDRASAAFYLLASAALCAGAWASRLHSLSYVNVALPAYAAVALMFGIAIHDSRRWIPSAGTGGAALAAVLLPAFALLQLIRVAYLPGRLVPTAEDVAAGQALIQRLNDAPGDVFVPYHGYLPAIAGKGTHAHAVVIADVIRGGTTQVEKDLADELDRALRTQRFESIVSVEVRTPVAQWLPIEKYYRPTELVVDRRSRFWRPEVRYVPR